MLKVKEAIVVEGRYDKNTLSQLVDTLILTTDGFQIFHRKEQEALLRRVAERRGLIILTDSDGAGFVIRNHLKSILPPEQVKQCYIPDVYGKEKRKKAPGKEGKLGVEGMSPAVLEEALRRCGATILGENGVPAEAQRSGFGGERRSSEMDELSASAGSEGYGACDDDSDQPVGREITKLDLYQAGLSGGADSARRRKALLQTLDLPEHLTANALVPVLNTLMTYEEFWAAAEQVKDR
ncbi:MAG: DUF4093 domain-containing protein [Clostridiales bacterium]|nr:DUF4093 domain-containing protein [Clostridiales bacterium]